MLLGGLAWLAWLTRPKMKELGPDYQAESSGSLSGKSAVEDRLAGIPALRTIREATPLKVVLKSPEEGCRPLLYSLLAPGLPSGGYIVDCALTDISPASKSVAARQELWEWTERWVETKLGSAVQEEQEANRVGVAATDETNTAAAEVVAVEVVTPSDVE